MDTNTSFKEKLNKNLSMIILAAGILVRFIYVLKSTIYDRQYDIGMIDLDSPTTVSGGHLAYIQYLYQNFKLPDVDPSTVYQFHHPPFHHFVSALFMRFVSIFTNNTDVIEESMQWVPFACSVVILIASMKILKRFMIDEKALCFGMALICFHPSLILLSGSVNNDCMALMFSILSILMTMVWLQKRDIKSIIGVAAFLGLGISTKQNVAELAFAIGLIFLIILIKDIREKNNLTQLIIQYALAGVISIPIGMWFYIRNLVKYNMSLLWVYDLGNDSWQYTGNYPVINRFLWPVPSEMIDNFIHFKIGCGYNVWMQIMRTSVLGEWDMASVTKPVKLVAVLLMFTGIFIAFVALICLIRVFVLKDGYQNAPVYDKLYKVLFVAGYVSVMISYLVFAYKYPQQCSMHFRYIEITLLFTTAALSISYGMLKTKRMRIVWNACLCVFSMLSMIMCAVWCLQ
jgi:hypothetical protein